MNRGDPPTRQAHYRVLCQDCGQEADEPRQPRCTACGGLLKFAYAPGSPDARPKQAGSLWNYAHLLPVRDLANIVSMGEGGTPLVNAVSSPGCTLSYKLENFNPTGSQKDRAVSVAISKARELGATRVLTASTGSSGLACAAYCARAAIACVVLVPEGTPPSRIAAMTLLGAHVIEVEGDFSETYHLIDRLTAQPGWYLAATNRRSNPWQGEGGKTIAYEIVAQAGGVPDWVVTPVGGGGTASATWRGFRDLHERGLIDRLPRFAGAYAARVDRFGRAVEAGLRTDEALQALSPANDDTVMYNLKAGRKSDLADAVATIADSGGTAVAIEEDDALAWQRRLAAEEGFVVEPSAAAAAAAVRILVAQGTIARRDRVVAIMTGSGFRDAMPTGLRTPLRVPCSADPPAIDAWIAATR
jgi:threonine synthase